MKIAVDTNVLVRYFTWDDEAQAEQAAAVIEKADEIFISSVVLCELVWVLTRSYRYRTDEILPLIEKLVGNRKVKVDRIVAQKGLALLAAGGDFADGVILAEMRRAGCEKLVTFDQRLARLAPPSDIMLPGD